MNYMSYRVHTFYYSSQGPKYKVFGLGLIFGVSYVFPLKEKVKNSEDQ